MKSSKSNIRFNYLYRDAGNYKQHGSIVFARETNAELNVIEKAIRSKLIDGEFFVASEWGVPELHSFPYDAELDHAWHEFVSVEETGEEETEERVVERMCLI